MKTSLVSLAAAICSVAATTVLAQTKPERQIVSAMHHLNETQRAELARTNDDRAPMRARISRIPVAAGPYVDFARGGPINAGLGEEALLAVERVSESLEELVGERTLVHRGSEGEEELESPDQTGEEIYFVFASTTPGENARRTLDQYAARLMQDPRLKLVLEGHTQPSGSDELDQELSARRVESVKAYLLKRGVPQKRISAAAFGATRAAYPASSGRNRRVVLIMDR